MWEFLLLISIVSTVLKVYGDINTLLEVCTCFEDSKETHKEFKAMDLYIHMCVEQSAEKVQTSRDYWEYVRKSDINVDTAVANFIMAFTKF
jgi:hypothetical protein